MSVFKTVGFNIKITICTLSIVLYLLSSNPRKFYKLFHERLRISAPWMANILNCLPEIESFEENALDSRLSLGQFDVALSMGKELSVPKARLRRITEEVGSLNENIYESNDSIKQKRDRVLFYLNNSLPFTNSGYTIRTHAFLTALSQQGILVLPVTRVGYPLNIGLYPTQRRAEGARFSYQRLIPLIYQSSQRKRDKWVINRLSKMVRAKQITLLHTTTDYNNARIISAVSKRTGIPWVYEVRGELENTWLSKVNAVNKVEAVRSYYYTNARKQELRAMENASAVLALSEVSKKSLVSRGVSPTKITVIPNAVEGTQLSVSIEREEARESLSLPASRLIMGSISSIVSYEGLDDAIRALTFLDSQWLLLIVGDGEYRPSLEQLANELNLTDRVIFAGKRSQKDILRWYSALDVFVLPRKDEFVCRRVTPLKALSAQALGVPVVCSDLEPLREVVGNVAEFVPANDPESIANAVVRAAHNDSLIAGGRAWAASRTWSKVARKYIEAVEDL